MTDRKNLDDVDVDTQLQGENNRPESEEAVEEWLAENGPLDLPIWVSIKNKP